LKCENYQPKNEPLSRLVEGNSINAAVRMTGVCKVTVLRLLADAGTFCADYHDVFVRGVTPKPIQMDEIWGFCCCKDKAKQGGAVGHGSVWTWVAMDADTKLVISHHVGARGTEAAVAFSKDVAGRIDGCCQLTTDGHPKGDFRLTHYPRSKSEVALRTLVF
jgi:hypothetical protein